VSHPRVRVSVTEVALVFGLWSVVGVLFGTSSYFRARLYAAEPIGVTQAAVVASLDVYTWAVITVVALLAARRFPLDHPQRWRHAAVHLGMALVLIATRSVLLHVALQSSGWFPPRALGQGLVSLMPPNFVSYWMLLGVAHAVEYARRFRERELRSSQLETQLARAQLQVLKMQLHPHFLFNTLHAISTLVHRSPDLAERMIANLSELLRSTLAHQQAQEISVQEEMQLLEPYLDIEKMRLGERLRLRLEIASETRTALVPHLILQPLVENAIRHGLAPRREGGSIRVRTESWNGRLRLVVEDDGRGFIPTAEGGAREGVGLSNTRARLQQLYGDEHRFRVTTRPGAGTRVEIEVPLRTAGAPAAEPHTSVA
jgi:two-component system, LytTR family, sensor kinase